MLKEYNKLELEIRKEKIEKSPKFREEGSRYLENN